MSRSEHRLGEAFHTLNRKRLAGQMEAGGLAVLYSNDEMHRNGDQNFPFRQQSDLFYLSGIGQEQTVLLLFPDHPLQSKREMLFIRESNTMIETWEGHKYTRDEATRISGIRSVHFLTELDILLRELMQSAALVYLNANEYPKYHNELADRNSRYGKELRELFPTHRYERLAPVLASLRQIKQDEEINAMRTAAEITGEAFRAVLANLKPGMEEYKVQARIEYEFTVRGSMGPAYAPIIASGGNALCLHYTSNSEQCKDGDLLLMDFGCEYAHYACDMSRTIPVNGRFSPRQRELYDGVLSIFRRACKLFVPGNSIEMVNAAVNNMMEKAILEFGLGGNVDTGNKEEMKALRMKYFPHGTSHFLGLDVHDVGLKTDEFKPGMVLTCEPGIYIKEEGIGIRIENDILVSATDPIDLLAGIPVEAAEIEELMNKGK